MKVQVQLGGERYALSIGVLDEAYCTEGKATYGVVVGCWVDEHVRLMQSLEVEDEMGWQEERERFEDGDGFLVDLA